MNTKIILCIFLVSMIRSNHGFKHKVENGVKILGCSFDDTNPSCAMKFRTNISVPTYSIALFSSQNVGLFKITDVTSITAPTANGEVCQIPYSDGANEYFHCRNAANECMTTNGAFAKCADGKFHFAKPNAKFEPYTVEFLLPAITLPEPGDYVAKFFLLMLCNKEGCEDAQDFIAVTVNDANDRNATLAYKEYLLNDLKTEKKWIPFEVKFKAATEKIYVVFHLGRRVVFSTSNFLAFDQLELFQLKNNQEVTLDTGSTNNDINTDSTSETVIDLETLSSPLDKSTSEAAEYSTYQTKMSVISGSDSTFSTETSSSTSNSTSSSTATTTVSTSTTTKESGPAIEIKVLDCNFDATVQSCGFRYKFNGTTPSYSISPANIQIVGTYKITDVTSITAPAANGELCQIPFVEAGTEYYHCRNAQTDCKTTSGVFSKCADGRFHYAKPSATKLEPYTVEYLLPVITLPEPGDFAVRFYVLMFCNKEGCDQAQDFISVTVNDANNQNSTLVYKEYMLNDLKIEKKWIPFEIKFKAATENAYLIFHFGRRVAFSASNLLAFDQVELYQLKYNQEGTFATGSTNIGMETGSTISENIIDSGISSTPSDAATSVVVDLSTESTKLSNFTETDLTASFKSSTSTSSIATSTKEPFISTTQDSTSSNEKNVFACSFDDTDPSCKVEYKTNISDPIYSIILFSSQNVGLYKITDVTSISVPTENGEVCQIPYSDGANEYFHCRNAANECKTLSGAFSKCAVGKFHYSKPNSKLEPYTVEFLLPAITLPESGDYVARFYLLMLCNKEGCEQAEDFISVTVNDANNRNNTLVYQEFLLKDLEREKKWIQYEVKFQATSKRIYLVFHLGRRLFFGASNLLAFDQVELFLLDAMSTVNAIFTTDYGTTTKKEPDFTKTTVETTSDESFNATSEKSTSQKSTTNTGSTRESTSSSSVITLSTSKPSTDSTSKTVTASSNKPLTTASASTDTTSTTFNTETTTTSGSKLISIRIGTIGGVIVAIVAFQFWYIL